MMSELSGYDYELPPHLIAQTPARSRSDARLLVVDRACNSLSHKYIRDLPGLLQSDDCLVINNTRVIPARLVGFRTQTGGQWEGLFIEADENGLWRVIGKTRGKLTAGETIRLLNAAGQEDIELELAARQDDGTCIMRPIASEEPFALLDRVGRVPLPPYIRKGRMVEADREKYQTVYAEEPGAVAAPTAGLHFTEGLLRRIEEGGVSIARLTLHVGLGTFRPISADSLDAHSMHCEWGSVGQECIDAIDSSRVRGGRAVAVGTTSVRLLETAAAGGLLEPFSGDTDLFIRPPYEFRAVDALLTNFHLPRTTLLVLVYTFGGRELIRRAYEEAIREEYRFYSYGDAMLIL